MATEPERKIEQLLRAYAQKRREEAGGFDLHPANRRLLQAEVARLRDRTAGPNARLVLLARDWLRKTGDLLSPLRPAGLAVSLLLILGLALWWVQPWEKQPQQFAAKTTTSTTPEIVRVPPPPSLELSYNAPVNAEPPQGRAYKSEAAKDEMLAGRPIQRAETPLEPALKSRGVAPPADEEPRAGSLQMAKALDKAKPDRMAGGRVVNGKGFGGMGGSDTNSLGVGQPKASPTPAYAFGVPYKGDAPQSAASTNLLAAQQTMEENVQLGFAGREFSTTAPAQKLAPQIDSLAREQLRSGTSYSSQISRERFASVTALFSKTEQEQIGRASIAAAAAATPLSSFVLERAGNRIRIFDADGSIYEGELLTQVEGEKKQQLGENNLSKDAASDGRLNQRLLRSRGLQEQEGQLKPKAAEEGQTAPVSAMSFRASGTNLTLKQMVTIQASVSQALVSSSAGLASAPAAPARPNAPAPSTATRELALRDLPAAESKQSFFRQEVGTNSAVQLQGTAQIGNKELPLRAIRVTP